MELLPGKFFSMINSTNTFCTNIYLQLCQMPHMRTDIYQQLGILDYSLTHTRPPRNTRETTTEK